MAAPFVVAPLPGVARARASAEPDRGRRSTAHGAQPQPSRLRGASTPWSLSERGELSQSPASEGTVPPPRSLSERSDLRPRPSGEGGVRSPRSLSERSETKRSGPVLAPAPLSHRETHLAVTPSAAAVEIRSPFVPDTPESASSRRVVPRHPALAALATHLADPEVTDVFINGRAGLFVDRGRGAERVPGWQAEDDEVRALAVALIGLGGRHIDDASPCVDVRLEGGIRVHAVLSPVAPDGAAVSIRVPSAAEPSLDDLQGRGMFTADGRVRLDALVAERRTVLITGATGSGKTTLLAAMLAAVPPTERIVTIEDVAELRIAHPHHVRLEARQANLEGAGGVDLARLVREALRMRPDRLVVGECRGAELRELLTALNTGHRGGAGTLHASGLSEVPARLEALGALAGLDDRAVARQAASAIEVVLHLDRGADGIRRIAAAGRLVLADGRLGVEDLAWPC